MDARTRKALIGAAAALVLWTVSLAPALANEFDQAREACERGGSVDHVPGCDGVLENLVQALRLNPNNAEAHYQRGSVYRAQGKYQAARFDFDAALAIDRYHPPYLRDACEAYLHLGYWLDAIGLCTDAASIDPSQLRIWLDLAQAYALNGQSYQVILQYSAALRLDARNVEALAGRCWNRVVLNQLSAALLDCNKALQFDKRDSRAHNARGFAYLKMGRYSAAIADYDLAAQRPSSYQAEALYGRGLAKLRSGDPSGQADIAAAESQRADIAGSFADWGVEP